MSIRRKGNGYEVRVYVGEDPGTGKKRYASKYVSDREAGGPEKAEKLARKIEAELMRQVETSSYVPPAKKTVAEHLEEWLKKDAEPNTKPRTYRRYKELVNVHVKPAIGAVRLDRLTPHHVATLLADKRDEGLSARTCLHIYRALHRALNVAVQWGIVGRNACDAVRPPRVDDPELTGLSAAQVECLLEGARTYLKKDGQEAGPFYPVILAAVHTGMRQGELLALRWQDVDLEHGFATVCQALEKPGKNPIFTTPKNRKPRVVPLSPEVIEALGKLKVEQEIQRAFHGDDYEDHGLVFCQPNGRPLDGHSLTRWHLKRLVDEVNKKAKEAEEKAAEEQAGATPAKAAVRLPEKLRFHDLRHTFVSRALQAGANPRAVSEIAGHHDPGFTLKRYAHALPQDTKEAVERLGRYLKRQTASDGNAPAR